MHLHAKPSGHAALFMRAPAALLQEHTHDSIEDAATALKCVPVVPAPMHLPLLLRFRRACSTAAVRWGLAHCRHCHASASGTPNPAGCTVCTSSWCGRAPLRPSCRCAASCRSTHRVAADARFCALGGELRSTSHLKGLPGLELPEGVCQTLRRCHTSCHPAGVRTTSQVCVCSPLSHAPVTTPLSLCVLPRSSHPHRRCTTGASALAGSQSSGRTASRTQHRSSHRQLPTHLVQPAARRRAGRQG